MEKRTKDYGLDIASILAQITFPQSSDDLTEGTSNKYFTDGRVLALIEPLLSILSTSDISEGSNKYFTVDRVKDKADLVAGVVPRNQLPTNYTPSTIRDFVKVGYFEQGELQGNQPEGSIPEMCFSDTYYLYRYAFSSYDTDGSRYAWIRLIRS